HARERHPQASSIGPNGIEVTGLLRPRSTSAEPPSSYRRTGAGPIRRPVPVDDATLDASQTLRDGLFNALREPRMGAGTPEGVRRRHRRAWDVRSRAYRTGLSGRRPGAPRALRRWRAPPRPPRA